MALAAVEWEPLGAGGVPAAGLRDPAGAGGGERMEGLRSEPILTREG
jgi:hypothetical protein